MDHPKEYRYIGNVPNLMTSLESAGRYTYFATQLEWTLCIPPYATLPKGPTYSVFQVRIVKLFLKEWKKIMQYPSAA